MRKVNMLCNPCIHRDGAIIDSVTPAQLLLVSSTVDNITEFQPLATSATVRDDYESVGFILDNDDGPNVLAIGARFAFGAFLSDNLNPIGNVMFTSVGAYEIIKASLDSGEEHMMLHPYVVFGRTVAETVTVDKAAPANMLENPIVLPSRLDVIDKYRMKLSWDANVVSMYDSTGNNYCAALVIDNPSAEAVYLHVIGSHNLINDSYPVFCTRPDGN